MNRLKGESVLEVDGKPYTLVFDINALCEVEDELGMDVDMLLAKYASGTSAKIVRGMIWAALQKNHPCTVDEVGDLMSAVGFQESKQALERAMAAAFPPPEEVEEKNPPKRRKAGTG